MSHIHELIKSGETVLDSLYDGVVVVDERGIIQYVNPANDRITGMAPGEAVGRYVLDLVPDSSLPEVIKNGVAKIGVHTRVGDREVISNIVPIRNRDGKIIGGVSVFRDISDVIRLQNELVRAEDHIARLNSEISLIRGENQGVVIGKNAKAEAVFRLALKASQVTSNVLIQGESGTGKEVLARYIHNRSPRGNRPFLAVNCAALPENLLESELFGYADGAFTGAKRGGKPGVFELAAGGTLFLDEIADMNLSLQSKLLRVLQSREVRRLGGDRVITVDVRVIAATNRDLAAMVREGQFRQDLFYRLNVISVIIPPLRERREDIPLFIDAFLRKLAERFHREFTLAPETRHRLLCYSYPGNVRELENILEQAAVLCDGGVITPQDLPPEVREGKTKTFSLSWGEEFPSWQEVEMELIRQALARFPARNEAAAALGFSRATLYRKMLEYGLRDGE